MRYATSAPLVVLAGAMALLPGCATKPATLLADDARRSEIIETLVASPAMRQEVVARLVGTPAERDAVFTQILADEGTAGQLIQKALENDRGKALVASRVAADASGAKTFIRMLMLTGVLGPTLSQQQADSLGMGDVFAFGNQRRTMTDMKRLGQRVEQWAGKQQGRYPVCLDFDAAASCLGGKIPAEDLAGLTMMDAWGNPILYHTDREGTQYVLISYASDNEYDGAGKVGPTESFACDIVFSNGDFIQWPGRIRKNEIR